MARKTPITEQELTVSRRMLKFREALKISRTDFAVMLGMGTSLLQGKESGRIPFRTTEIARIKQAATDHVAAIQNALDEIV